MSLAKKNRVCFGLGFAPILLYSLAYPSVLYTVGFHTCWVWKSGGQLQLQSSHLTKWSDPAVRDRTFHHVRIKKQSPYEASSILAACLKTLLSSDVAKETHSNILSRFQSLWPPSCELSGFVCCTHKQVVHFSSRYFSAHSGFYHKTNLWHNFCYIPVLRKRPAACNLFTWWTTQVNRSRMENRCKVWIYWCPQEGSVLCELITYLQGHNRHDA